jgi:hypothetical protein
VVNVPRRQLSARRHPFHSPPRRYSSRRHRSPLPMVRNHRSRHLHIVLGPAHTPKASLRRMSLRYLPSRGPRKSCQRGTSLNRTRLQMAHCLRRPSIEQLTDGDVGGHTHQPAGHSAGIGFPQPSMQFKAASGLQPGRSVAASCTPVCPPHAPKATKVTAPTTDADFECGIALPYHCRSAFRGPGSLRTVRGRRVR